MFHRTQGISALASCVGPPGLRRPLLILFQPFFNSNPFLLCWHCLQGISALASGVGPLGFAALFSALSRTDSPVYAPQ